MNPTTDTIADTLAKTANVDTVQAVVDTVVTATKSLSTMEHIYIAITGITVVILALWFMAFIIEQFKHLAKIGEKEHGHLANAQKDSDGAISDSWEEKTTTTDTTKSTASAQTAENAPAMPELTPEQLAAVLTAVAIEWRLYYEEEEKQITFDYDPARLSNWKMSGYLN